jgi:hypothetical protein
MIVIETILKCLLKKCSKIKLTDITFLFCVVLNRLIEIIKTSHLRDLNRVLKCDILRD